ncbi:YdaU family protein [Herbaspirillum sp. SJZ107]|uniref:YdaU family protein n=1 Tax=Herbaspirillum sp. SJZ107 TaxID=2572881 RepID=UPI0011509E2A|nr:YdaU family protein [Herbaspirillum sp. SJZ107]TQK00158.1 uncharacterized protein DUF1376 [Herbaspirillum sp. SJZ107]
MNFYKHFLGDYNRATGHLTLVEHGAFRLMLDHFYGAGRPLPGNRKSLYRLLRAESEAERRAVDAIAVQFWRPLPAEMEPLYEALGLRSEEERRPLRAVVTEWTEVGGLINVRALGEMVKARVIAEKNKQTAIEREQKKRLRLVSGGRS